MDYGFWSVELWVELEVPEFPSVVVEPAAEPLVMDEPVTAVEPIVRKEPLLVPTLGLLVLVAAGVTAVEPIVRKELLLVPTLGPLVFVNCWSIGSVSCWGKGPCKAISGWCEKCGC